jgi:poly-gamma-glutamate capsule biosynthesis protein CapA/YwtB (metallophosphatase superfamily)
VAALAVAMVVLGLVAAARSVRPAARPTVGAAAGTAPGTERRSPTTSPPAARITLAFAGDVHFAGRTLTRLTDDPATAFGEAASALRGADLTMVNLETSITERGTAEPKTFTFRAPATAFAALRGAGVDVAAITSTRFPTVGIGATADQAYAPYYASVRGHRVALLAASQIRDRTLSVWSAGETSPGIASAYDDRLVAAVRQARAHAEIVVVYLHWGVEGQGCPSGEQRTLAARLAGAGADAVVGTHAHLLLGGGYLGKTYVAYGLGNYLWWRDAAFSNDTGVLRLTFQGRQVVRADLNPARIDQRGVPVPAAGETAARIGRKWAGLLGCTGLSPA